MSLRKKTDAKVTGLSAFVTVTFYVLISFIFWNVGGADIVREFVITVAPTRRQPPPPPPRRPPQKIKLRQPPRFQPRFDVKQPHFRGANVQPDFGNEIIPIMDNEADLREFTRLAKTPDILSFNQSLSNVRTASLDIGGRLGIDLAGKERIMIVNTGKRIRAKTVLAKFGKQSYMVNFNSLAPLVEYLNRETRIRVAPSVKEIKAKEVFAKWYEWNVKKQRGASSVEQDQETQVLKELGVEISLWAVNKTGYRAKFVDNIKSIWREYLRERFPLTAEELGASRAGSMNIAMNAHKRYKLYSKEEHELQKCTHIIDGYTVDDVNDKTNRARLEPVYKYLRLAVLMNYPFLFGNYDGASYTYNEENVQYLRDYLNNGGFFYLDDTVNPHRYHRKCRELVARIMDGPGDEQEEGILKRTYDKIAGKDCPVAGYELGNNTPNPFFGNTFTYIPYTVPRRTEVTLTIFNRVGQLVRTLRLGKKEPGRYRGETGMQPAAQWDSKDDGGQPVESGVYFVQMASGLFQQTRRIEMSRFRRLDAKTHPVFSCYNQFKGAPYTFIGAPPRDKDREREFGTTAFGLNKAERTIIIYTEWSGILQAMDVNHQSNQKPTLTRRAQEFFTNILALSLTQDGGLAKTR